MRPNEVPTVAVNELAEDAVILDVREEDEWVAGHIAGAQHVPMMRVPHQVDQLPNASPLVVVCKVGGRSAQVTAWLSQHGIAAVNLDGGMLAWAAAGRHMVSETGRPPEVA